MEGWQVWDLALACAGQLRIAPSGVVLGFDYGAVLTMAHAVGVPKETVAILMPAIERCLMASPETDQDGS